MSRYLRLSLVCLAFLLCSISMVAQTLPQLYWQMYVDPDGAVGFPNIVWFDLNGLPGPPPVPANIPIPAGSWSPQGGQRTIDAVQAPGQPGIFFLLTSTELRAFRINGGTFPLCGSARPSTPSGLYQGIRVAPSGSFALMVIGSNPAFGSGLNELLSYPLNLAAPRSAASPCILPGNPTPIPIPTNTAITNVDFNPTNAAEVAVSGYSNIVTFVDPSNGTDLCDVAVSYKGQNLNRLVALYRPDGNEVWAASYEAMQIAVIAPPPACTVTQFITGFGQHDALLGASFHPDPAVGVYFIGTYDAGYTSNNVYALDTTTKTISDGASFFAAIGSTSVTRGPGTYLFEVAFNGYTNTYDVSDSNKAHNFGQYLIGSEITSVTMSSATTLRTVNP